MLCRFRVSLQAKMKNQMYTNIAKITFLICGKDLRPESYIQKFFSTFRIEEHPRSPPLFMRNVQSATCRASNFKRL